MNTTLTLRSLVVCLFLGLSVLTAHAGEGYSIVVKIVHEGGEPHVSEVSGVNMDWNDPVTLPVLLPHTEMPATLELDFDIGAMTVDVTIEDLILDSNTQSGKPVKREYFRAARFFKWGEEATLCKTATETVSLIVTPPKGEAGESAPNVIPAAEATKLEASFKVSQGTIRGEVYNPSDYFIDDLYVRAVAEAQDGFEGIDRIYKDPIHLEPQTADTMQIDARLPPLPDGVEYKITVERATGRKDS